MACDRGENIAAKAEAVIARLQKQQTHKITKPIQQVKCILWFTVESARCKTHPKALILIKVTYICLGKIIILYGVIYNEKILGNSYVPRYGAFYDDSSFFCC